MEVELSPPYPDPIALYRDVDRNLVLVLDAYAREGVTPACTRGCDACCHQLVMATVAEARAAAAHVAAHPDRKALEARLAEWSDATADLRGRLQAAAGDAATAADPPAEDDAGDGADPGRGEALEALVDELAAGYFRRGLACPFLIQGSCAIYEGRPLACRHHFAVGDPALCASGGPTTVLEAVEEAFFASQDAIPAGQDEIGIFPELVALELAGA